MTYRSGPAVLTAVAVTISLAFAERSAAQTSQGPARSAPVAVEEPRDIVADLYKRAAAEARRERPTSPFFDRSYRGKSFSKGFDVLITEAETRAAHDGDQAFDFDPISASQDAEIQKVTLVTDALEASRAVVAANFLNHGRPTIVRYDFVRDDGAWKINDIHGTIDKEAWSIRKILAANGREPKTLPGMPDAPTPPTGPAPLPPKKDPSAR